MTGIYKPRQELRPHDLEGISDDQIAQHWKLYEGYVENVNLLNEKINLLSATADYGVEFSELKRRESFEYNGMVLHEFYFGILKAGQPALQENSGLANQFDECFGSFEGWKKQFIAMGITRGAGWVILYHDPHRNVLTNFWIKSHEDGHPAGFTPLVVMDVWEHAYMVDWGAAGRRDYIEKFFQNIDWVKAESAFRKTALTSLYTKRRKIMGMRTRKGGAAAVVSALLALGILGGAALKAAATEVLVVAPMAAENKRTAFRKSMRKLWADHVIWTRSYIVAAVADSPDASETASRLLRNQAEIGAAFVPYFGEETGAKLGQLLKEHILIAADIVAAAKKGDDAKFQAADSRWHGNAVEIAALLNAANPNWSKEAYVAMFNDHLALTTKQATARIHKKWADDISAFDEIYAQMLMMADDLADGIIKQFPEKI